MDKLEMFQEVFGKVDEFGWWDMDRIQTEAATHFTSKDFQEDPYVHVVRLVFMVPDHQEINGQVEGTWEKFQTIVHSIMVHAGVS